LEEATKVGEGGDREERPVTVENAIKDKNNGKAVLTSPLTEGAYRLFVYISDGHNKIATANVPFYVKL